jgi:hypothetical protein
MKRKMGFIERVIDGFTKGDSSCLMGGVIQLQITSKKIVSRSDIHKMKNHLNLCSRQYAFDFRVRRSQMTKPSQLEEQDKNEQTIDKSKTKLTDLTVDSWVLLDRTGLNWPDDLNTYNAFYTAF